jgi:hypothetical protein
VRAYEALNSGFYELSLSTNVGVLVGCVLPPSGSMLTATAAIVEASTGTGTTATPLPFGTNVTEGDICVAPVRNVQA